MLGKLFKLAYMLDKGGLYDEAKQIEDMMKSLSERVGMSNEELVAVADFLDQNGETALADKFDEMVKVATKKI